jgi:hypothetical protein
MVLLLALVLLALAVRAGPMIRMIRSTASTSTSVLIRLLLMLPLLSKVLLVLKASCKLLARHTRTMSLSMHI